MNVPPAARLFALLVGVLGSCALAHGESATVNLRGAVLCLDPAAVELRFEETPAERQRQLRGVRETLRASLLRGLWAGGVRHETRASCRKSLASTRVVINVRYLNPKTYVGFGDPAYSYTLGMQVGSPGGRPAASPAKTPPIGFASSLSDIHSEARTKQPLAKMLAALGQTQAQDLVRAWQKANPRLRSGS